MQAVETGALNAQQSKKAWSVSATLRGFYDDNFNSQASGNEESSTGVEIRPTVDFGMAGDQSSFNVGYDFTARYFEKVINGTSDHSDFTHQFDTAVTHALSERVRFNASESFVVGQEPDLQRGTIDNPQRISGDNARNYFQVGANVQVTSLLGLGVGYNNTLVDYDDEGNFSNSARLDRMQHGVNLDSKWAISPQTAGIFGVRIGRSESTRENELIDAQIVGTNIVSTIASQRDSRSLILYGGVEHEFDNTLSGSFLAGGQRVEFPNDPNSEAKWSPWVESSLTYQYQEQTSLSAGFSYSRSSSDLVAGVASSTNSVDFVRDSENASVYATLTRKIAAQLTGSGTIRYQSAKFNGGALDGKRDNFLLLGLNLGYQFTPNFEGSIGYNFDDLSSDQVGRSYDRNKFYVGVTAKY